MNRLIMICALVAVCLLPVRAQYIGTIRLSDSSVRVDGDSVRVSFKMDIDREGAAWFSGILLTPALTVGKLGTPDAKIVALPDVMVQGKNKYKATERGISLLGKESRLNFDRPMTTVRVVKDLETTIYYNQAVAYEGWMSAAQLSLYEEIINYRNERQLLVLSLSGKVEDPSAVQPVDNRNDIGVVDIAEVPAAPQKRVLEGEAFIDFPVGRTEIQPSFSRNTHELDKIRKVLSDVQNTRGVVIDTFAIKGYASVEGTYANNERLAYGRSMALKEYIMNNFSLPLSPERVTAAWEAEDWDGLARLVEESNLNGKDRILKIIRTVPIFEGREVQLMNLDGGRPYRTMLREMFPQLRRVAYRIEYTIKEE